MTTKIIRSMPAGRCCLHSQVKPMVDKTCILTTEACASGRFCRLFRRGRRHFHRHCLIFQMDADKRNVLNHQRPVVELIRGLFLLIRHVRHRDEGKSRCACPNGGHLQRDSADSQTHCTLSLTFAAAKPFFFLFFFEG